jgi:hypothetical protein
MTWSEDKKKFSLNFLTFIKQFKMHPTVMKPEKHYFLNLISL